MSSDVYAINSNISWKLLGDTVAAVNLDDGNYYTFNATASMIWQCVEEKKSLTEIELFMSREFPDMDTAGIKQDIKEITDYWISEKLISSN
jgi:hypothetical protein